MTIDYTKTSTTARPGKVLYPESWSRVPPLQVCIAYHQHQTFIRLLATNLHDGTHGGLPFQKSEVKSMEGTIQNQYSTHSTLNQHWINTESTLLQGMVSRIAKLSVSLQNGKIIQGMAWQLMEKLCNIKSLLRPLWPHQILAFRLFILVEFCTFRSGISVADERMEVRAWDLHGLGYFQALLVLSWWFDGCEVIFTHFSYTLQHFKHLQTAPLTNIWVWKMVNTMEYQQNDPIWSKMIQNAYISMWENDEHPLDLMATWLCPRRLRPFHQALSFGSSAAVSHHAVVIFLLRGRRKTHLLNWWYSCPWKLGGWCSTLQSRILSFLHIVESVSWGCH